MNELEARDLKYSMTGVTPATRRLVPKQKGMETFT